MLGGISPSLFMGSGMWSHHLEFTVPAAYSTRDDSLELQRGSHEAHTHASRFMLTAGLHHPLHFDTSRDEWIAVRNQEGPVSHDPSAVGIRHGVIAPEGFL